MNKEIIKIQKKIAPILKKYNITKAGIFGSYASGRQKNKSDVDILVEIAPRWSLYDVIGIKLELERELKKKVDLVEYELIKPELREIILKEEVPIKI